MVHDIQPLAHEDALSERVSSIKNAFRYETGIYFYVKAVGVHSRVRDCMSKESVSLYSDYGVQFLVDAELKDERGVAWSIDSALALTYKDVPIAWALMRIEQHGIVIVRFFRSTQGERHHAALLHCEPLLVDVLVMAMKESSWCRTIKIVPASLVFPEYWCPRIPKFVRFWRERKRMREEIRRDMRERSDGTAARMRFVRTMRFWTYDLRSAR